MPNYTSNYNLIKPKKSDNYDIDEVTNTNMDILDNELAKKITSIPGKGLSSNDFSNVYKRKIEQMADAKKGTTFIPNVDLDGNLFWTNDGDMENPPPVNIKGPAPSLDEYIKKTDFASEGKAGIFKLGNGVNLNLDGTLSMQVYNLVTYSNYQECSPDAPISKGTFEFIVNMKINEKLGDIETLLSNI